MQLPKGTYCPLLKKDCITLQCAWFTCLRGTHPQTGKEIDEWMCAISAMPMLQIEVAKEARQGAAATESFRNEMVEISRGNDLVSKAIAAGQNRLKSIENL